MDFPQLNGNKHAEKKSTDTMFGAGNIEVKDYPGYDRPFTIKF